MTRRGYHCGIVINYSSRLALRTCYCCIRQNPYRAKDYSYCPNVLVDSVVVEVVMVLVIFVTVSRPGAITLSTKLKELPGTATCHLGVDVPSKEVQVKFTPPTVCSLTLVGVGLM